MSATIVGGGLGLFGSSLTQQNGFGAAGRARIGAGADGAYVNAANGNLIVQGQDEFMAGLGVYDSLIRTYNSQGRFDGDNNDGWRMSVYRSLDLSSLGAGSGPVRRISGDGHVQSFTFVGGNVWRSDEGLASHDVLRRLGDGSWEYQVGGASAFETFDASGKLIAWRDADNNLTTLGYTGALVTSITDGASQQVTLLAYEGTKLQKIEVRRLAPGAETASPSALQSMVRVTYEYDNLDRLSRVVVDLKPESAGTADGALFATRYLYDGTSARVTNVVQTDGSELRVSYVEQGGVYRVKTMTDALGRTTEFHYDVVSRRTDVADALGNVTSYTYDTQGRLTKVTLADTGGGARAESEYVYDANNNIKTIIDELHREVRFEYDDRGNLRERRDQLGNTVQRTYDSDDRLLTETIFTVAAGQNFTGAAASGALTTRYVYDANRHLSFVIAPDNSVTQYSYNARGLRTSAVQFTDAVYTASTASFSDLQSWANSLADKSRALRIDTAYDATGQVVSVTRYQAVDASGAGITNDPAAPASVSHYVYDSMGRLLAQVDPKGNSTSYAYDGIDRVLSVTDATSRVSLTAYNDAGNLTVYTAPNGLITTAVRNKVGEVVSQTQSGPGVPDGTTTYTYDADGRLRKTVDPTGAATHYIWDARGRQIGVVSPEGELTETVYSDAGQVLRTIRYASTVPADRLSFSGPLDIHSVRGGARPNVRPVVDLDADNSSIRGSGYRTAVYVTSGSALAIADSDAVISDADNATLGSLTITLNGIRNAGSELLSYTIPAGSGITRVSGTPSEIYQFTGPASAASFSALLNSVKYVNNAAAMGAGDRTIDVTASDGAQSSNFATTIVSVVPNLSPVISGMATVAYVEDKGSVPVGANIIITDPDSGTMLSARIRLENPQDGNKEVIGVTTSGTPLVAQYDASTYTISIFDPSGAAVTKAQMQSVLRTLRYANTAQPPNTTTRNIVVQVNDGATDSVPATIDVTVSRYQGPYVDLNGPNVALANTSVNSPASGAATALLASRDLTITNPYSATLVSARVQITPVNSATLLALLTVNTAGTPITARFVPGITLGGESALTLVLTGTATLAQYRQVLKTLEYSNTLESIVVSNNLSLNLDISVNDGVRNSNIAKLTILPPSSVGLPDVTGLLPVVTDVLGDMLVVAGGGGQAQPQGTPSQTSPIPSTPPPTPALGNPPAVADGSSTLLVNSSSLAVAAEDRSTYFFYDKAGRLVYQIDAGGYAAQIAYDGAGRKVSETRRAIPLASIPVSGAAEDVSLSPSALDRTLRYFYDANGHMAAALDADGYLKESVYNRAGQLVETIGYAVQRPVADRATGTLTQLRPSTASPNDQHTYFRYDGQGRLLAQIDAERYLTVFGYDASGNRTRETRYYLPLANINLALPALVSAASVPGFDQTVTCEYDNLNRKAVEVDAQQTVTTYAYDPQSGLLTSSTRASAQLDALGRSESRTTSYRYDVLGRLISSVAGEGSAALAAASTQQQRDSVFALYGIQSFYDRSGRLTKTIDQNLNKVFYFYDGDSRLAFVVKETSLGGEVTKTTYNAFGELTATTQYVRRIATSAMNGGRIGEAGITDIVGLTSGLEADADNRKTEFQYGDKRGLLTRTKDALGFTVVRSYNQFGELIGQVSDIGATPGAASRTDVFSYNKRGQVISKLEGTRLTQVLNLDGTDFDAFGRATRVIDPAGNVSATGYDRLGRVVTTVDALGKGAASTYDAFSRVLTRTDRMGAVTEYSYDDAARTVKVRTPEGIEITTASNRHGQKISVTLDNNGAIEKTVYDYDKDGRLTKVTDPLLNIVQSEFDKAGLLKASIDQRGYRTTYEYDGASRVLKRTVDPSGLNLQTFYEYDAFGGAIRVKDANGVTTETVFDRKGQAVHVIVDTLSHLVDGVMTAPLKIASSFEYDARGKTLRVLEGRQAENSSGAWVFQAALKTTAYEYDQNGWRTRETADATVGGLNLITSYAYDQNGNMVRKTDPANGIWRYFYDRNNRQTYAVDALGDITESRYDAEGRLTKSIAYATAVATGIDDSTTAQQLSTMISGNTSKDRVDRFVFDRDGRKVFDINAVGVVTKFIYDDAGRVTESILYATPVNPASLADVALPSAVLALIQTSADDQSTRSEYDAAGRLKQVTDAENYTQKYTYDAAGNKKTYTNQNGAIWGYNYDAAGRLIDEIAPSASVATVSASNARTVRGAIASVSTSNGDYTFVVGRESKNVVVYRNLTDGSLEASWEFSNQTVLGVEILNDPTALALSLDQQFLYVLNANNDIDVFVRNGNALSYNGTVQSPHHPFTFPDAITPARSIAVAEDYVFITRGYNHFASESGGVDVYTRDATTGALVYLRQLEGPSTANATGVLCVGTQTLFVISPNSQSLSRYEIGPDIVLSKVFQNQVNGVTGLDYPMAMAADSQTLYVVGSNSIAQFSFINGGSFAEDVAFKRSYNQSNSVVLENAQSVRISDDGRNVYVGVATGILTFARDGYGADQLHADTLRVLASTDQDAYINSNPAGLSFGNGYLLALSAEGALRTYARNAEGILVGASVIKEGDPIYETSSTSRTVQTRFVYDNLGNLTHRIENFTTGAAGNAPESRVTSYKYDALGRQVETINADRYSIAGRTYGQTVLVDGSVVTSASPSSKVTFDAAGRAIILRDEGGRYSYKIYDAVGRVRREVDADGYVTRYGYDALGNVDLLRRFSTRLPGFDSTQPYTLQQVMDMVIPETLEDRAIYTQHDALGRQTSIIRPASYTYNSSTGQYIKASPTTNYAYDAFGALLRQDELSNLDDSGNASWDTMYFYYDRAGRQIGAIDAMGYLTEKEYSASNQVTRTKEWATRLVRNTSGPLTAGQWNDTAFLAPTGSTASANGPAAQELWASGFATGSTSGLSGVFGSNFKTQGGNLLVGDTAGTPGVLERVQGQRSYTGSDTQKTTFIYEFSLGTGTANVGQRYLGIGNWDGTNVYNANSFGCYLSINSGSISTFRIDQNKLYAGGGLVLDPNVPFKLEIELDAHGATMYLYPAGLNRGGGYTFRFDSTGTPTGVSTQMFAGHPAGIERTLTVSSIREINGNEVALSEADLLARTASTVREKVYVYDGLDRLIEERAIGVLKSEVQADGRIRTSVSNVSKSMQYDGAGNVTVSMDELGAATRNFYDARGRLIATLGPASAAAPVASFGNVIPLTTYAYDSLGNMILEMKHAKGSSSDIAPVPIADSSGADVKTYNIYDTLGRVTSNINAMGARVDFWYDAYGNQTRTEQTWDRGAYLLSLKTTKHTFNGRGLETSATELLDGLVESSLVTDYNAFGEVTLKSRSGGTAADQANLVGAERYEYDVNGRLIFANRGGVSTVYLSDLRGNATAEIQSATVNLSSTYWANLPTVAQMTSDVRRTETEYDSLGRIVEQRLPQFSTRTLKISPEFFLSSSANVPTLTVDSVSSSQINADLLPGATITLRLRPAGSNGTWSEYFSIAPSAGEPPLALTAVLTGKAAGEYEYQLEYSMPDDSTPSTTDSIKYAASSGNIVLAAAGMTGYVTSGVSAVMNFTGGTWYYEFSGASLAGMTGVEVFTGDGRSVRCAVTQVGSVYRMAALAVGSGPLFFRPLGTTVPAKQFYSAPSLSIVGNLDGNPTTLALLTGLFQGQLTVAALGTRASQVQLKSFEYKPAGSDSSQPYITLTNAEAITFLYANAGLDNKEFDFRIRLQNASGADFDFSSSGFPGGLPNGAIGAANGTITGQYRTWRTTWRTGGVPVSVVEKDIPENATVTNYAPVLKQKLDRWGNVTEQTDAAGMVTSVDYDESNRVIRKSVNAIEVADTRGILRTATPTWLMAYDAVGRDIASIDANGNLTSKRYNARGDLLQETNGVQATTFYLYDALGRMTARDSSLGGRKVSYTYDRLGRLTRQHDSAHSVDTRYAYDDLGNRISDNGLVDYVYDIHGNVVRESRLPSAMEGGADDAIRRVTTYQYDALGRKILQQDADGYYSTWTYDFFGRLIQSTAMSGNGRAGGTTRYDYDLLGNKTRELLTRDGKTFERFFSYYENGLLKSSFDPAYQDTSITGEVDGFRRSEYRYDVAGRLLQQRFTAGESSLNANPIVFQDTLYRYDAAGRIVGVTDQAARISYAFDAQGNHALTTVTYITPDYHAQTTAAQRTARVYTHLYQYDYDAANRIQNNMEAEIITDTSGNQTLQGIKGAYLQFNQYGNRVIEVDFEVSGSVSKPSSGWSFLETLRAQQRANTQSQVLVNYYDAANRLVRTEKGNNPASTPTLISARSYNDYDQVIRYETPDKVQNFEYNGDGSTKKSTTQGGNTERYWYDAAGSLIKLGITKPNGSAVGHYIYQYDAHDSGRLQAKITAFANGSSNEAKQTYDYRDNQIELVVNNDGRIVRKDATGSPAETALLVYQGSNLLGDWTYKGGAAKSEVSFGVPNGTADRSAFTANTFVVNQGDTLQSIALAVYGDASLWYVIADANSIAGGQSLAVGTVIKIPNQAVNANNNQFTFRPYNAGEYVTDITPSLPPPPPPPKKKCGALLTILVVVVAVVATVFTAGALAGPMATAFSAGFGVLSGTSTLVGAWASVGIAAVAGAVGSAASQLVAIGVGLQEKFSWSQVGVGALTSAFTAGIGASGVGSAISKISSNGFVQGAMLGTINSAAGQGINIAFKQQDHFSWSSVAAGAVAGALGASDKYTKGTNAVGKALTGWMGDNGVQRLFSEGISRTFAGVARRLVEVALDGHGKIDVKGIAADAFGNALGNSIVNTIGSFGIDRNAEAEMRQEMRAEEDQRREGDLQTLLRAEEDQRRQADLQAELTAEEDQRRADDLHDELMAEEDQRRAADLHESLMAEEDERRQADLRRELAQEENDRAMSETNREQAQTESAREANRDVARLNERQVRKAKAPSVRTTAQAEPQQESTQQRSDEQSSKLSRESRISRARVEAMRAAGVGQSERYNPGYERDVPYSDAPSSGSGLKFFSDPRYGDKFAGAYFVGASVDVTRAMTISGDAAVKGSIAPTIGQGFFVGPAADFSVISYGALEPNHFAIGVDLALILGANLNFSIDPSGNFDLRLGGQVGFGELTTIKFGRVKIDPAPIKAERDTSSLGSK